MDKHPFRVAGVYERQDEAQATLNQLVAHGLKPEQLHVLVSDSQAQDQQMGSDKALKEMLVDTAIGTVVGGSVGALGQMAIAAANVSLFIASPLVAPLAMVGWGAALGMVAGAGTGIVKKRGDFSSFVTDAMQNGYVVLIAYTLTEKEKELAQTVIAASGKGQHEMQVVELKGI